MSAGARLQWSLPDDPVVGTVLVRIGVQDPALADALLAAMMTDAPCELTITPAEAQFAFAVLEETLLEFGTTVGAA